MASTDVLLRLQAWYADQSDGEWEHSYGVRIDTLDNPGWAVRIDLNGTSVEDRALDREEVHRSKRTGLSYGVTTPRNGTQRVDRTTSKNPLNGSCPGLVLTISHRPRRPLRAPVATRR